MWETGRRAGGGSRGELHSCSRAVAPFVKGASARGSARAAGAPSSGALQKASALPTHMAPELTIAAHSSCEVPARGNVTRLLLTNVRLFIPLFPQCHLPHSSPGRGQAGSSSRADSLVTAEGAEGRLCPQESCRHRLPDWHHDRCLCFLKQPS